MRYPKTLGIIMDGNRRWSKNNNILTKDGHEAGAKKLQEVLTWLKRSPVENIVCYAFSTENWQRNALEVAALMGLLERVFEDKNILESGYRLTVIGETHTLSAVLLAKIQQAEKITAHYTKRLYVALSYSGRAEIIHACNTLIKKQKTIISEQDIQNELYTKDIPDPDLIIRTGGRHSLSNFLLWQSGYAELYVTDTLWPDFTEGELLRLCERFSDSIRKMGT